MKFFKSLAPEKKLIICITAAVVALAAIVLIITSAVSKPEETAEVTESPIATATPAPTPQATAEPTDLEPTSEAANHYSSPIEDNEIGQPDETYEEIPPYENAAWVDTDPTEYYAWMEDEATARYDSAPKSYQYSDDGFTITVGVSGKTNEDAIYLVFTESNCLNVNAGRGVYCDRASHGNVEMDYFNFNTNSYEYYADDYAGTVFHVASRYWNEDTLIPSVYENGHSYLTWRDNQRALQGVKTYNDTVSGRLIDFLSGQIIALFEIHIEYDEATNTYSIVDITGADVADTGELTTAQRQELIDYTFDSVRADHALMLDTSALVNDPELEERVKALNGGEGITSQLDIDYDGEVPVVDTDIWGKAMDGALVDHLSGETYFGYFYDPELNPVRDDATVLLCRDVFAISFPFPGYGNITAYVTPAKQYNFGFTTMEDKDGNIEWFYVGLDAPTDGTKEGTILVNDF